MVGMLLPYDFDDIIARSVPGLTLDNRRANVLLKTIYIAVYILRTPNFDYAIFSGFNHDVIPPLLPPLVRDPLIHAPQDAPDFRTA